MKPVPNFPEELKFPVSLDKFLRYTAGGKSKGERLKKFRAFISWELQFQAYMVKGRQQGKKLADMPKPSLAEVGEIVASHREKGFEDQGEFWGIVSNFKAWLAAQPAIRARKAANERWSQKAGSEKSGSNKKVLGTSKSGTN